MKSFLSAGRLLLGSLLTANLLLLGWFADQPSAIAAPLANIYWTQTRQEIDGFGASGAFSSARTLMNYPENTRNQILDLLFSPYNGAGLSILRNQIGDGVSFPTIEPSEGSWNWTGDEGQIQLMYAAKARGVNRLWSSVWSPPAWMKDNGQVINGGQLRTDKYQAYADYLARYVSEYKSRYGLDIYAISAANEPDYTASWATCIWSPEQFNNFIKNNLKPTFAARKTPAKVILAETSYWTENMALAALNDPLSSSRIDIVAAHNYDYSSGTPFTTAKARNKKVWQTEVSYFSRNDSSIKDGLIWAKQIHSFMTVAEASAWHYWWLAKNVTDGEALINLDTANYSYSVNKRLFTIGNFSRFVRPGYIRLNSTTSPAPGVYTSAYKDSKTGKFAIVVINENTSSQSLSLKLNSFNSDWVVPYITSATQDLVELPGISLTNGGFNPTLPAQSVTTFVG